MVQRRRLERGNQLRRRTSHSQVQGRQIRLSTDVNFLSERSVFVYCVVGTRLPTCGWRFRFRLRAASLAVNQTSPAALAFPRTCGGHLARAARGGKRARLRLEKRNAGLGAYCRKRRTVSLQAWIS